MPLPRISAVSARVSIPLMPTMPSATSCSSSVRRARQDEKAPIGQHGEVPDATVSQIEVDFADIRLPDGTGCIEQPIDVDADQIRNNDYGQAKILGDIQTYRFEPDSFDLVICYNVIEHLADAESALRGFCGSLKQGGLLLIGAPNPKSLSGVVTKYTPHWFHVWYYRYVRGDSKAGQPGEAPFPTFFHPLVTLSRLETFAATHGLEMLYRNEYESPRFPEMRVRKPRLAALLDAFAAALNFLLPGTTDVRRGDYHVILRKR